MTYKYLIGLVALLAALGTLECTVPDSMLEQEHVQVMVSEPRDREEIGYSSALRGYKYAVFVVMVANIGKSSHHANPNNLTLIDSNDNSYHYDMATHDMSISGKDFPAVDVPTGKKAAGVTVFQIPKDAVAKSIIYKPMFGKEVWVNRSAWVTAETSG
jgi:hypothetical protein